MKNKMLKSILMIFLFINICPNMSYAQEWSDTTTQIIEGNNDSSLTSDTDFIDNEYWQEITGIELNSKYYNGEPFVAMLYRPTCLNCKMRSTIIGYWLEEYDNLSIYGVDLVAYGGNAWMGNSGKVPIICFVKDSKNYAVYTGADSMRDIQKALNEYMEVYAVGKVDFYTVNNTIYSRYSTDADYISGFLPADRSVIAFELITLTERIIEGLESDYDKLKAIHDWVSDNIYYDYNLIYNHIGSTSVLGTYLFKSSVSTGYANLTAALCQAAGIPCRVVSGYAVGVGTDSMYSSIWEAYEQYLVDGDLEAFQQNVGTNHDWNEAFVNGRWIIVDTTWDSGNEHYPGNRIMSNPRKDTYFDPSMEVFSAEHLMRTVYASGETLTPDISLDNNILLMEEGDTTKLTVSGSSGTAHWFTSDEDIVTVNSSGDITAVSEGEAIVSVTALVNDSYYKTTYCTITVSKVVSKEIKVTLIDLDQSYVTINGNETFQIKATVYPETASNKDLEWSSSDIGIAVVDQNGLVTAISKGEATVVAKTKDGSEISADCLIEVLCNPKVEDIFNDMKTGTWYYNAVRFVYDNGIMSGKGNGTFDPGGSLTRAEFATTLHSMEGKPEVSYRDIFIDVPNDQWYSTPVLWSSQNNIASGYGNGKFGISDYITREQLAMMVYKYATDVCGYEPEIIEGVLEGFNDIAQVSSWAVTAMEWAVTNGIISGTGNNQLNPQGNALRCECAQILKNVYEMLGL